MTQSPIFSEKRMVFQTPGQNFLEKVASGVKEFVSNLSETAQLVHEVMCKYVMDELEKSGLIQASNELAQAKLSPKDPRVLSYMENLRRSISRMYEKAKKDGCNDKKLAVITNYGQKLGLAIAPRGTV